MLKKYVSYCSPSFVHGLIVVNDDIECIAAAGLDGDKLLVGVLAHRADRGVTRCPQSEKPTPGSVVG